MVRAAMPTSLVHVRLTGPAPVSSALLLLLFYDVLKFTLLNILHKVFLMKCIFEN